jgi:hypothetical protein
MYYNFETLNYVNVVITLLVIRHFAQSPCCYVYRLKHTLIKVTALQTFISVQHSKFTFHSTSDGPPLKAAW